MRKKIKKNKNYKIKLNIQSTEQVTENAVLIEIDLAHKRKFF